MLVVAVSGLVLIGWGLGISRLTTVAPGLISMKVNTAVCLMLLALAVLAPRHRIPAAVSVVVVVMVCGATLVEYVTGVTVGLDQLLVADPGPYGRNPPGRMAVLTAVCLALLALAQLALLWSRWRMAQGLAAVTANFAFLAVLGYAYGAEQLYSIAGYSTMAPHTAVALLLLCFAIASSVPGGVLWWMWSSEEIAAVMLRRLVPVGLIGIPLLGLVRLRGEVAGWYGTRFGLAVMAWGSACLLLASLWGLTRTLRAIDASRLRAQRDLDDLNAELREGRDRAWVRAEQLADDLEESRRLFNRAIAKSDDLVWTVEIHPAGRVELTFASDNGHGLFGGDLPPGGDVGQTMASLVHPDDLERNHAFNLAVAAGQAAEVELRLVGFDAHTRWVWARGTPRREGERLFFDGITTNITQRHMLAQERDELLERQVEQIAQLNDLARLREDFLAVTGHELRNPLAAIRGFAELLVQHPGLDPTAQSYADIIARRSAHVGALTDDLFDLTRLSAGLVDLALVPVDLDKLLRQAVEDLEPTAAQAGITLAYAGQPAEVEADTLRLRQVVDNLITNAIKYSPPDSVVTVTGGTDPTQDTAVLAVTDQGSGIPADERDRIFELAYRTRQAKDSPVAGSGLGLTITKALVEAHGGHIEVQDAPGGGARFVVTLPQPAPVPTDETRTRTSSRR